MKASIIEANFRVECSRIIDLHSTHEPYSKLFPMPPHILTVLMPLMAVKEFNIDRNHEECIAKGNELFTTLTR